MELPEPHPSDLFASRSARMLHSTSPRVASTNPKIGHRFVHFCVWGSEAYARHAMDKHTGINPSNDLRRGPRLLREPIDHHTPLLSEPDRPSRDPLGLQAPCSRSSCRGSFFVIYLGRNRRCSWNVWAFSFSEFSSTRVIVWVSVHTSIRLLRRTNSCSLSAEIRTNYEFDAPRTPLRSFSINNVPLRTAVRRVASTTIIFAEVPTTVQHNGLAVNSCHISPGSLL